MSNTNIENIKQSLLENIADWIDSYSVQLEIILSGRKISESDNEEIHIAMADAAMKVFLEKFKNPTCDKVAQVQNQ